MHLRVNVSLKKSIDHSYAIHIGRGLLGQAARLLLPLRLPRRAAIVTDSHVDLLYAHGLVQTLLAGGFDVVEPVVFPEGEASKTRETKAWIEDRLLAARLGRDAWIAALGGGVVGDVAGFVAATYLRGIPFVQFPTTLLAMVDSSVGGKTGVDTPAGKNLIGAFWQPRAVITDTACLDTLPETEFHAGLGEIIKHAIIADADLFDRLVSRCRDLCRRADDFLPDVIRRNCEIKARVVESDEHESDSRKILNFGHTLGHAIETAANYTLLHGECIAIGMRYESRIANAMGILDVATLARIESLLDSAGFSHADSVAVSSHDLVALTRQDKKARDGRVEYVLPEAIGRMHRRASGYGIPVDDQIVLGVLEAARGR